MKTRVFITIVLFVVFTNFSYSQYLTSKSGGRIFNSENRKVSPAEARALLASTPELLNLYNQGRSKKTIGTVFIIGGVGLIAADLLKGLTSDVEYPSTLTYVGGACILVSIPVKIGAPGKIKKAIEGYNNQRPESNENSIKNVAFVSDRNGIGLRLTF